MTGSRTGSPRRSSGRTCIEDVRIRDHIRGKLSHAGLSDIHIRKDSQRITIDIYTARPGIVIGKSGSEVEALRQDVHAMTHKAVHVNINEIKRPELDANLVAQSVAEQLQNRVSFRRAMKRSLASAMRSGAQGVRIRCGGRLGGAEMSRTEQYSEGRVPAAHAARRHRLRLRRGADPGRPNRRQGLDQQGRDHARRLRGRPAADDAPRRGRRAPPARRHDDHRGHGSVEARARPSPRWRRWRSGRRRWRSPRWRRWPSRRSRWRRSPRWRWRSLRRGPGGRGQQTGPSGPSTPVGRRAPDRSAKPAAEAPPGRGSARGPGRRGPARRGSRSSARGLLGSAEGES